MSKYKPAQPKLKRLLARFKFNQVELKYKKLHPEEVNLLEKITQQAPGLILIHGIKAIESLESIIGIKNPTILLGLKGIKFGLKWLRKRFKLE